MTAADARLELDVWHHLVFTYDGARATFYVDGEGVLVGNISGPLPSYGDPNYGTDLFIGTWANLQSASSNFLPGTIDEVAIWNRSLSESEVVQLFKSGLSK